jgi:hypothetical protein
MQLNVVPMDVRYVAHKMIVPEPSGAAVQDIPFFNNQYSGVAFRCPYRSHQTCDPPANAQHVRVNPFFPE